MLTPLDNRSLSPTYLPFQPDKTPWITTLVIGLLMMGAGVANYYLKGGIKLNVLCGAGGSALVLGGVGKGILDWHRGKIVRELNLFPDTTTIVNPDRQLVWITLLVMAFIFGVASVVGQFCGGSELGVYFFAGAGGLCLTVGGILAILHWNRYQAREFYLSPESQYLLALQNQKFKLDIKKDDFPRLLSFIRDNTSIFPLLPLFKLSPIFPLYRIPQNDIAVFLKHSVGFATQTASLLNEKDSEGDTALDRAFAYNKIDLAREIYRRGGTVSPQYEGMIAEYGLTKK